jgi:transposase-like protein
MNTIESNADAAKQPKRTWRRHSDEFKARVIEQAGQAHVSVAAVALANGINANMLRCWLRESSSKIAARTATHDQGNPAALAFVQLPMQDSPVADAPVLTPAIEVQIHRGETRVVVSLPLGSNSAAWLREVLG